jgi:hypothetical protein
MSNAAAVSALEGWIAMDEGPPRLLGRRCSACGTYFFPPLIEACRNPVCAGGPLEEVPLSRTGRIWSYTNACYQPPEPFVSPDPFEPFAIAAVELERERMVVLGQVVRGVGVESLKVGMPMELVYETLHHDGEVAKIVWKWRPLADDSLQVIAEPAR